MKSSSSLSLLDQPQSDQHHPVKVVLRMTMPWYREAAVIADTFGAYKVQFAVTSDELGTHLYIGAFPVVLKKNRDLPDRPVCALSGSFETQPEVIDAWEKGFVVVALEDVRPPHLARAVVKDLLGKKLAEPVKF